MKYETRRVAVPDWCPLSNELMLKAAQRMYYDQPFARRVFGQAKAMCFLPIGAPWPRKIDECLMVGWLIAILRNPRGTRILTGPDY
jgi:hypothetical protein